MSVVTTVVLSIGVLESLETVAALQEQLLTHGIGELGDLCDRWSDVAERGRRWGGTKYPEINLYGAAYNYLDLSSFMDLLLATPWNEPDDLQLWVCEQEDVKFTVYEIIDGAWQALHPSGKGP